MLTRLRAGLRLGERIPDYAWVARRQLEGLLSPGAPTFAGPHTPIVLLPGVYETWHVMREIATSLHAAGHEVHPVPSLGRSSAPVADLAERAARILRKVDAERAIVVAHSKGGLVGKALMLAEPSEGFAGTRVLGLVAVATPWRGSRYARGIVLPAVHRLRPRDPGILALGRDRGADARIVAVRPAWDPHVPDPQPPTDATPIRVPVTGHFRILADPLVIAAVHDGVAHLTR